MQTILNFNP